MHFNIFFHFYACVQFYTCSFASEFGEDQKKARNSMVTGSI